MAEQLKYTIETDSSGAIKSMTNLKNTTKNTTDGMSKGFVSFSNIVKTSAIASIAGLVLGMKKLASSTLEYGDKLHKLNQRLNVSVENLDKLNHIADLSGVSFDAVTKSIGIMSRNLDMARRGTGEAADAFKEMGLNVAELLKLSPIEQFLRLTEAIIGIENPTIRNATAMKLLGRSGIELISMFPDLRQQIKDTASVMTKEGVESIATYNDSITTLKRNIEEVLKPVLIKAVNAMNLLLAPTKEERRLAKLTGDLIHLRKELETVEARPGWFPFRTKEIKELKKEILETQKEIKELKKEIDNTPAELASKKKEGERSQIPDMIYGGTTEKEFAKIRDDQKKAAIERELAILKAHEKQIILEKEFAIRRLELMGMNEQAEIESINQQFEDKYALAEGNHNLLQMLEEQKALEIQSIRDRYAKEELDKVKQQQEELNKAIDDDLNGFFDELDQADKKLTDEMVKIKENLEVVFSEGLTDSIFDFIDGTNSAQESFAEFASSFLKNIAKMILQQTILNALQNSDSYGGIVGGIVGLISGARADGGPVNSGKTYLVGEKGPELFTPGSSGNITPNNDISGSSDIKITNNINISSNGNEQDDRKLADLISRTINEKIKKSLVEERRSGGILNRQVTF